MMQYKRQFFRWVLFVCVVGFATSLWHCPAPSSPDGNGIEDGKSTTDSGTDTGVSDNGTIDVGNPNDNAFPDDGGLDTGGPDVVVSKDATPDQSVTSDTAVTDVVLTPDKGAVDEGTPDPGSPGACENGVKDPGETNVDCGGGCPTCVEKVTQFGITWTFDKGYRVGQFANGDYWVLGPVKLVGLTPTPKDGLHGFEINPSKSKQPFDKRSNGYDASLMPAVPTKQKPLDVAEGSIVSTESNTPLKGKCKNRDNYWPSAIDGCTRSHLKAAAILTVLKVVPPKQSFRPAYMGTDKSIKFNVADLDRSKLKMFAPTTSVPKLSSLERHFERPWLDHMRGWSGAFLHPGDNMHNYGREIAKRVGDAALMLLLDFSKLPNKPTKDTLLIRFVQLGIDLAGMVANGQTWPHDGGHGMGRKMPILFAGTLLNDKQMLAAGAKKAPNGCKMAAFQEDSATFYVSDAEVAMTASSKWSPDKRATPRPYTSKDKGIPEWGIRHTCEPNRDNFHWSATYRSINGAGYAGFVLAAHLMGLRKQWAHPALFDFSDRWAEINGNKTGTNGWSGFHLAMWTRYRDDVGCRWTRDNKSDTYSQGHFVCAAAKVSCTWQQSACNGCVAIKSCGDYPDRRTRDYDPCQLKCR